MGTSRDCADRIFPFSSTDLRNHSEVADVSLALWRTAMSSHFCSHEYKKKNTLVRLQILGFSHPISYPTNPTLAFVCFSGCTGFSLFSLYSEYFHHYIYCIKLYGPFYCVVILSVFTRNTYKKKLLPSRGGNKLCKLSQNLLPGFSLTHTLTHGKHTDHHPHYTVQ